MFTPQTPLSDEEVVAALNPVLIRLIAGSMAACACLAAVSVAIPQLLQISA